MEDIHSDTKFETAGIDAGTVESPKKDTEAANWDADDIVGKSGKSGNSGNETELGLTNPDLHCDWVFEVLQGRQRVAVFEAGILDSDGSGTMYDFHNSTDIFVNLTFLPCCTQKAP